jgi:hypothetical protein
MAGSQQGWRNTECSDSVSAVIQLGTGTLSSVRIDAINSASGNYSTVFGTRNSASAQGTTIGGGGLNSASCDFSTTSGGTLNSASGYVSIIGGGLNNTASGYISTIGGGRNNTASANYTGILGGACNVANQNDSFIVGTNITTDRVCTTFVNNLSIINIPTSEVGLPSGSVYRNASCELLIVP